MYLINKRIRPVTHCSQDIIEEFEKAILSDNTVNAVKSGSQSWFIPLYYIEIISRKIGIHFTELLTQLFVLDSSEKHDAYFAVLMGGDFNKFYPYAFFNRKKRYIYIFDAWTKDQSAIINFIRKCKIDRVFISSSQAVTELNVKLNCSIASWVPEGIDISAYKHIPYNQKDIDVIQIGRKFDWYHEQILPFFSETKKIYLYEKTKGTIIFPDRIDFINGLAKSKISVCFPSNITHPERAGEIETMTNRYLQSMASKCLIVGHAPREMVELFGYNPVIEIDKDAPTEQLKTILGHYSDFIPLIEKNFEIVSKHHTWKNRWEQINNLLSNKCIN